MGNVDRSVVASTAGRDMRLDGGMGGEEEEGVEGACTLKVDTAMASVRLRVARVFRRVWMRSRTWVIG